LLEKKEIMMKITGLDFELRGETEEGELLQPEAVFKNGDGDLVIRWTDKNGKLIKIDIYHLMDEYFYSDEEVSRKSYGKTYEEMKRRTEKEVVEDRWNMYSKILEKTSMKIASRILKGLDRGVGE
jgi:hypothetical protein